jgi:plastocyanin
MNSRIPVTIGSVLLAATAFVACNGNGSSNSYTAPMSPTATTSNPAPPSTSPNTPVAATTDYPSPTQGDVPAIADVIITINGMADAQPFSPRSLTLKTGQTVAWVNADTVPHTATSDSGVFKTAVIAPGATSAPITMNSVGVFPYHCEIHPSMKGTVVVVTPLL